MLTEPRRVLNPKLAKSISRCLVLDYAGCRLSIINHARYAGLIEPRGPQQQLKRQAAAAGLNRGGLCDTKMLRAPSAVRMRGLPTLVTTPMHCRPEAAVQPPATPSPAKEP